MTAKNRQIILVRRPPGLPALEDFAARFDAARTDRARHTFEGKLRYRDDIAVVLESAPRHLLRLFDGSHRGKLMVKITDPGEGER